VEWKLRLMRWWLRMLLLLLGICLRLSDGRRRCRHRLHRAAACRVDWGGHAGRRNASATLDRPAE